jgi:hypothetical protein
MNDTELREQFGQLAAPLLGTPAPDFGGIRRRARRRMAGLAAASGGALAVFGIVAGVLVSNLAAAVPPVGASLWGSGTYPAPPGQPYVVVNASASGPAELRNVASGAVVGVLHPLGGAVSFTSIAAAPGGRLFVLAQQGPAGQVSFAELRIGSGSPPTVRFTSALTHVSLPAGTDPNFMAVSAAGDRLALAAVLPDGTGRLLVYDLRSGSVIGNWKAPDGAPLSPPQFIRGADELAVEWSSASTPQTGSGAPPQLALRLVSTVTAFPAGSSLLADSAPSPGLQGISGTFSQDGSVSMNTINGALLPGQSPAGATFVRLLEYSAASGKLLHAIAIGPASALQSQYFCGVLWASTDGRDLLTQCGTRQQEVVNGKVTVVRLPWTFPAQLDPVISPFAW